MKHCFYVGLLLAALALPGMGQDEGLKGIKVTSTLRDDGSRTDLQKDFDSLTAESKTYDAKDKLIQSAKYTINEQGRILEGAIYDANGKIGARVAYTYDDQGRMAEQFDQSAEGKLLRRLVYHYDANGRISGIDAYDGQGNLLQPATSGTAAKKKARPPTRK